MSKEELGESLGKPQGYVGNLEAGLTPLHYEDAIVLAKVLNIEYEELLNEHTRFCSPGYGARIRKIRMVYELSQSQFAELIGVNRTAVSIWEAEINRIHPNYDSFLRLKKLALEKSLDMNQLIVNPDAYKDDYEMFTEKDCAKKIKYIRAAYGVHTAKFSEMLGLAGGSGTVSLWESGKTIPLRENFNRIRRLAEKKNIDLDRLNADVDSYKDAYYKFIEQDVEKKILYMRLCSNLFQDEFGRRIGCAGNTVSEWEDGHHIPTRANFEGILLFAEENGFDLDELNSNPEIYRDHYAEIFCAQGYGQRIQEFRRKCDLSMREFGKLIDVSASTVSQWEKEQRGRRPSRKAFHRIKEFAAEKGVEL